MPTLYIFLCVFLCLINLEYGDGSAGLEVYIVFMDLSAMPRAYSTHQNWYLNTLAKAQGDISWSEARLVYSYTNAINGFSASLSSSELEVVKNSPGFVSCFKDREVKLDTTHSYQFLGLNSGGGTWPDSNYGEDVIIGVVDTGVWPESESFKDDGMRVIPGRWKGVCEAGVKFNSSACNRKLVGARYFNRGLLAGNPSLKISMNSARDTAGHGTHTSSTAAGIIAGGASFFGYAPGAARGVAPKARVAIYKAVWEEGSSTSDIIAAIDQAIADGVDVLSLSLGLNGQPLYSDPIAIATFAAMEKGIFVAASSGNDGPKVASLHNGAPWVLTVAAGTMDRDFQGSLTLGNGAVADGLSLYYGNYSTAELQIVFMAACDDEDSLKKQRGKIVVCSDSGGSLGIQIYCVQDSNLTGAVFISNDDDLSSRIRTSFPALFYTPEQGRKILDYIKSAPNPKARLSKFGNTAIGTTPAPQLPSYSSRGPALNSPSVLKPDIMAPGDLILASWPPNLAISDLNFRNVFSNFNIISGTSMATPHAAGIAALLRGARPDWSPAAIRSAMITTAYHLDNTRSPIKDLALKNQAANPLGIGGGHIDPNRALNPGLIYDASPQDYINLLCSSNFTAKEIRTITRLPSYFCSNPSLDLNYPSFIAYYNSKNYIQGKEFHRTVTNVGGGGSTFTAQISGLGGLRVAVSPERLEFREKQEKKSFKLVIEGGAVQIGEAVVHGSLTWVETTGKYTVRSPVVVTRFSQ